MLLTRMHLNPARRGTRFLLASPQRLHAAVMCGFAPQATLDGPSGRVLWRIDRNRSMTTLYVSSPSRPDLTHLVEQAGWPSTDSGWQTVDGGPFLARLEDGQEWVFRLTANPVHNVRAPEGGRGKRLGHVTVAHQEQWLLTRAAGWGFAVTGVDATTPSGSLTVHSRQQLSFARRSDGQGRQVTLSVATFDGVLRVVDPDLLRAALLHGVGRSKGYGCGLITLAPMS